MHKIWKIGEEEPVIPNFELKWLVRVTVTIIYYLDEGSKPLSPLQVSAFPGIIF
ncbi:hypothetical protein RSJ42_17845 [Methanosarcina hadiensis]|uniref:hypothetical protein n=1 Tax=Methanosarcina hadiensis TaxID=3078083 RepID=UPI0039772824